MQPTDSSAQPGFIHRDAAHDAFLGNRPQRFRAVDQGWIFQAKVPQLLNDVVLKPLNHGLSVRFDGGDGWLRMMVPAGTASAYKAASGAPVARFHDAMFEVRSSSGDRNCSLSLLVGEIATGVLRVAHRLSRSVAIDNDLRLQRFRLESTVGQGRLDDHEDGAPVFLAMEFDGSNDIDIRAFGVVPTELPPPDSSPYLSSPLPACIALAQLNRDIAVHGRRHPAQWQLRAVEIASSLDCFQTAEALLEGLEGQITPADTRDWPIYVRMRAHVGIVTGAVETTRDFLLTHLDTTLSDDRLTTALSACLEPDPLYLPLVGRLPSGQINRYYLSRLPSDIAALAAAAQAPVADDLDQQVQRHLFLASQLRGVSVAASLARLNSALTAYQLAPLLQTGVQDRNVLDGMEFGDVAPRRDGPLISVIMAAYNSEHTIGYAARSILAQSHRNLELLICDDASSDATASVIAGIAVNDTRVRAFRSPRNQGPYNIRMAMIEAAGGEFITFADADDICHPERLERQLAALVRPADGTDPVCSIASWLRMMPDGRIPFFRDQRATRGAVVSLFAHASLFREGRAYRSVLCGGDTDFYEMLRQRYGTGFKVELPEPLLFGLWSGSSLTRQPGLEATEDGYRSPARLALSEICARQRLFGSQAVPDEAIETVMRRHGIHRHYTGAEPIG